MNNMPIPVEEFIGCVCIIVFCVIYMFTHWDDFFPY